MWAESLRRPRIFLPFRSLRHRKEWRAAPRCRLTRGGHTDQIGRGLKRGKDIHECFTDSTKESSGRRRGVTFLSSPSPKGARSYCGKRSWDFSFSLTETSRAGKTRDLLSCFFFFFRLTFVFLFGFFSLWHIPHHHHHHQ